MAVNLNSSPGNEFKIERGVRQGCLLAPYLFLIVGEVFTHLVKRAKAEGRIHDISLLGERRQQSIIQYADDYVFVDELVRLLRLFSDASGMKINWEKTCAYWFDKFTHKPVWLAGYNWRRGIILYYSVLLSALTLM